MELIKVVGTVSSLLLLAAGLGLRFLLDLQLAKGFVKYFHWLPVRWLFREKIPVLRGKWAHIWDSGGSKAYERDVDRHGHPELKQFGPYVYAEFYSRQEKYAFFGRYKHGYVVGEWHDVNDPLGYFGSFQLEVKSSTTMLGLWVGHSKTERTMRHGQTDWQRMVD